MIELGCRGRRMGWRCLRERKGTCSFCRVQIVRRRWSEEDGGKIVQRRWAVKALLLADEGRWVR